MPVGCYRYHAFKIIHHAYMYVHTKCGIDGVVLKVRNRRSRSIHV
jgi:hypothetical protein